MNHATHNHVLLGHLGVKPYLVQLLVAKEHENCHQRVSIMEVQQLCAMVNETN